VKVCVIAQIVVILAGVIAPIPIVSKDPEANVEPPGVASSGKIESGPLST
jgi:hypothetical protein